MLIGGGKRIHGCDRVFHEACEPDYTEEYLMYQKLKKAKINIGLGHANTFEEFLDRCNKEQIN